VNNVPHNTVAVFDSTGVTNFTNDPNTTDALANAVTFAGTDPNGPITVVAGAGSYTGDLVVSGPMTIEADGKVTTTGSPGAGNTDAAIQIGASGVTVGVDGPHGLTIVAGANEVSAIDIGTGLSNVTIAGNTITAGPAAGAIDGAILVEGGGSGISIHNNTITSGNVDFGNGATVTSANFSNNDFDFAKHAAAAFVGLNVSGSTINGNNFSGNNGVLDLAFGGVQGGNSATGDNGVITTVNGSFTLHDHESLDTLVLVSGNEDDQINSWKKDVGITLDPAAAPPPPLVVTQGTNEVSLALNNGGEIDLFAHNITVAQVAHDYSFA